MSSSACLEGARNRIGRLGILQHMRIRKLAGLSAPISCPALLAVAVRGVDSGPHP